ncbi:hypothetical protein D1007_44707 [Hordeum vulgare]|nr:hypothetical protein D1007_44707 [Hordeum vulgare]
MSAPLQRQEVHHTSETADERCIAASGAPARPPLQHRKGAPASRIESWRPPVSAPLQRRERRWAHHCSTGRDHGESFIAARLAESQLTETETVGERSIAASGAPARAPLQRQQVLHCIIGRKRWQALDCSHAAPSKSLPYRHNRVASICRRCCTNRCMSWPPL